MVFFIMALCLYWHTSHYSVIVSNFTVINGYSGTIYLTWEFVIPKISREMRFPGIPVSREIVFCYPGFPYFRDRSSLPWVCQSSSLKKNKIKNNLAKFSLEGWQIFILMWKIPTIWTLVFIPAMNSFCDFASFSKKISH